MKLRESSSAGVGWVRRIVVAADGSEASEFGLHQVADIARRLGASVTVVFVRHLPAGALMAPAPAVAQESALETLDELEADIRRDATRILGGEGVEWDFVVRMGGPGEELVKAVRETDADLVVVGSNRHTSLHNLVLGSTAAYLTAHSPAPVLVMRARVAEAAATPSV